MKLYYSDTFELPLPDNHRFPMAKYTLLRERILDSHLANVCSLEIPRAATDAELALVHTQNYIEQVKSGDLTDLEIKRIGFPWSGKMVERSRRSTGASIAAGLAAADSGLSANLAGGTHHSFADRGQGYCVFNDTCVAAKVLQSQGIARRVAIVDLDVHQGNGTSSIADGDDSLFSFSMHCGQNFPFEKTDGDLDYELPVGCQDDLYLCQLKEGLQILLQHFEPDFAFYLAGADPYEGDRLGRLNITKIGLRQRDQLVIDYFRDLEIPVSICMAGGYAPDIEDIVDIHFATIEIASARFQKDRIAI